MAGDRRDGSGAHGKGPGGGSDKGGAGKGAGPVVAPGTPPFVGEGNGDDDWDSDLAAWDAAIPIVTRAPVVPAAAGRPAGADVSGATPEAENPFFETPITVVSESLDLDDLPDVLPAGSFDDGAVVASGSYAALITTDASAPGLFEREPAIEEAPSFPFDLLPEMEAAAWSGDLSASIALGPGRPAAPDGAYLETLGQILAEERAAAVAASPTVARDRGREVALGLAAARVAEALGRFDAASEHLRAVLSADGGSVAAHRARLLLAERGRGFADDAAVQSLARLALMPHPDQPYYRSLRVEWILARAARGQADGTAAAMITSAPEGLGRLLAEAELAWREPTAAAALLETAAHRLGGGLGAALLVCAAGLNEVARDFGAAAEQRFLAARLDDQRTPATIGSIRDLARLDGDAVVPALEELVARVPPSPLRASLARWGAAAALRTGDRARAWGFVADVARLDGPAPAQISETLARDRLDLTLPGALAVTDAIAPVAAAWSAVPARVCLAVRACELANDEDGVSAAIAAVESVLADAPDAFVLGPAVEALVSRVSDREKRRRVLGLWRRVDPARWASASFDLADTWAGDSAATPAGDTPVAAGAADVSVGESVWGAIENSLVASTVFWRLAALRTRQGDSAAAAAHIDRALERPPWSGGALAVPLAELAAELVARQDVAAAVSRLEATRARGGGEGGARLTLERALRRQGERERERWDAYAAAELSAPLHDDAGEAERQRRAALALTSVFWRGTKVSGADLPARLAPALDLIPLEPTALGVLLSVGPDATALAERWAAGSTGTGGDRWTVAAAVAAAVGGDPVRALALALEVGHTVNSDDASDSAPARAGGAAVASAAAALSRSLAWTAADGQQRPIVLRGLATAASRADVLVEAAEAAEAGGDRDAAARLFEAARTAPGADLVASDARAGLDRVSVTSVASGAGGDADRLGPVEAAARAGRWDDVVDRLVEAPPHEDTAGVVTLSLALEIDDGRSGARRADDLWSRAWAAFGAEASRDQGRAHPVAAAEASSPAPAPGDVTEPPVLRRAADRSDRDARQVAAALEELAGVVVRVPDNRSAALYLLESARLGSSTSPATADPALTSPPDADRAAAHERRLRAAVAHDPQSAPATMAWRRWLMQAGRLDDAAAAAIMEADALVDPTFRVEALLRAAAMLSASVAVEDWVSRAADCLRRALAIIPTHHEAFARLRDLYEESGRHAELVDLLGARAATTTNPFEVTALRLARTEILAGPLAQRGRAKLELEAILQKEPQHERALGRLADLEQEDGNDAAAAEILIRRAFAERSPEKLRELFLRLGRIYTQRAPDAKRAVGAFTRVLQLDANNREALDELSRLYVGLGETKSAIAITERLVRIETDPERRAEYHVRLGHLAERGGDPRAASVHFHRAVEESPRDIEALGELVRHLEKSRDTAGRRVLLDRAAGDLRAAVVAAPTDAALLEALVAVSRWRGRNATAAAAAELLALVAAGAGEPGRVPDWASPPRGGRRLAALTKPSVDEQTFGPAVLPSVRHLFRLLGPLLWEGGRSVLSAYGVDRGDRLSAGRPPRDILDTVAGDLAAGPFDAYVVPVSSPSAVTPLLVEPGRPATILIGAPLLDLGPVALRFLAGRTLRLMSTHLDVAVAGTDSDLGAWLGGIIRQYSADYRHPDVSSDAIAARAARVAKLLPRKLRQEVMPFAMESSGPLDLRALRAGIIDGANRVGLVASGSLAAALRVILAISGGGGAHLSADAIAPHPEALTLVAFALSDEHDDLVRSLE